MKKDKHLNDRVTNWRQTLKWLGHKMKTDKHLNDWVTRWRKTNTWTTGWQDKERQSLNWPGEKRKKYKHYNDQVTWLGRQKHCYVLRNCSNLMPSVLTEGREWRTGSEIQCPVQTVHRTGHQRRMLWRDLGPCMSSGYLPYLRLSSIHRLSWKKKSVCMKRI